MADRTLPYSLDAERAVLGAILLQNDTLAVATPVIGEGDFFRDAHRRIFKSMVTLASREIAIDLLTLQEALGSDLDEVGGPAYITALVDGVPRSTNVRHYATTIGDYARRRELIAIGNATVAAGYDIDEPVSTIVETAQHRLGLLNGKAQHEFARIADVAREYIGTISAGVVSLATGFVDLDALIGGVAPGDLVVLAGRPGAGKSALALGIGERLAIAGIRLAFFSLEEGRERLVARLLSWRTGASTGKLERGLASDDQYAALGPSCAEFETLPFYIDDGARSLAAIDALCQRLGDEHGALGCIVIDYLQLLLPEARQPSREQEVAAMSRGLKRLAQRRGVVVLALAQLNRAPETRRDKRPYASDLRESGALEADANLVLLIHRPEMYGRTNENAGLAELIVAKNRSGPTGMVRLAFRSELAKFENLAASAA